MLPVLQIFANFSFASKAKLLIPFEIRRFTEGVPFTYRRNPLDTEGAPLETKIIKYLINTIHKLNLYLHEPY